MVPMTLTPTKFSTSLIPRAFRFIYSRKKDKAMPARKPVVSDARAMMGRLGLLGNSGTEAGEIRRTSGSASAFNSASFNSFATVP